MSHYLNQYMWEEIIVLEYLVIINYMVGDQIDLIKSVYHKVIQ
jgi:hypothetical protein